jgi:superfamily II RNA helicase
MRINASGNTKFGNCLRTRIVRFRAFPSTSARFIVPAHDSDPASNDEILSAFLDYLIETGIEPYDHQEQAILELFSGNNVILNTPTGSGKSLVALALHFRAICQNRRSYYTVPIKALANEKFLSLCHLRSGKRRHDHRRCHRQSRRPVICCTAEILANMALREGARRGWTM